MELVKNVFFNTDKLIENTTVKISYTGTLFQDNNNDVFIHYGFGTNWEDLSEIKMEKTELGFQAELKLLPYETFNFCFRNSSNLWDNNNGLNYIFSIEQNDLSLVPVNNTEIDTPKRLRKSYIWNKKIKLAIYKAITYLPRLISGNYKRKIVD